jgi:hypothetical protein
MTITSFRIVRVVGFRRPESQLVDSGRRTSYWARSQNTSRRGRVLHTHPLLSLLNAFLSFQRTLDHIPIEFLPLLHPSQTLRVQINDSHRCALHVVLVTANDNRTVLEGRREKIRKQIVSLLRHPVCEGLEVRRSREIVPNLWWKWASRISSIHPRVGSSSAWTSGASRRGSDSFGYSGRDFPVTSADKPSISNGSSDPWSSESLARTGWSINIGVMFPRTWFADRRRVCEGRRCGQGRFGQRGLSRGFLEDTGEVNKRTEGVFEGLWRKNSITSLGSRTLPFTNILSMFIVPWLRIQSSQSAYNAFLTLSGSEEYSSNGQYNGDICSRIVLLIRMLLHAEPTYARFDRTRGGSEEGSVGFKSPLGLYASP